MNFFDILYDLVIGLAPIALAACMVVAVLATVGMVADVLGHVLR